MQEDRFRQRRKDPPRRKEATGSFLKRKSEKDSRLLRRLLAQRNQYPDQIPEIDKKLIDSFSRTVAILVLDMVGFSRLTIEFGIIHYLAMIHEMHETAVPAVYDNGGTLIKFDADNLYAIYDRPDAALESALDIFRAFDAVNVVAPENRDIRGCIGIGFGETLVIDDADIFGSEVNIACKLGEDFAGPNEILLTTAAYQGLPSGKYVLTPASFVADGLQIDCHRYERTI